MPFFFALLAFGFYYYHMLKYFCAKTFDDVILDLQVEALAFAESPVSNARHAVWDVDAFQMIASVKRRVSNTCYAVWDVDAFQMIAVFVFATCCVPIRFD